MVLEKKKNVWTIFFIFYGRIEGGGGVGEPTNET